MDRATGSSSLGFRGVELHLPRRGERDAQTGDCGGVGVLPRQGDAFASGFLYGFLQGWTLERAARMGNACGAIVVTRHGCANFMPTLDEVSAFAAEQGVAAL